MRCFARDRLEYYIHKTNYDLSVKDHLELMDKFSKLSPSQISELESSFEKWIQNKKDKSL